MPFQQLEKLDNPPIIEVVCGFLFEPIPGLDPVVIGTFWASKRNEYPTRQFHPVIDDSAPKNTLRLVLGGMPFRTWLVSGDDAHVLQIQPDRFYFNWRKRPATSYPRFSDRGDKAGVLRHALKEFQDFQAFCKKELSTEVKPNQIELAKIDLFVQRQHWNDKKDLCEMMPPLATVISLARSESTGVDFKVADTVGNNKVTTELVSSNAPVNEVDTIILRLETKVSKSIPKGDNTYGKAFEEANSEVNSIFDALIPRQERDKRFGVKK